MELCNENKSFDNYQKLKRNFIIYGDKNIEGRIGSCRHAVKAVGDVVHHPPIFLLKPYGGSLWLDIKHRKLHGEMFLAKKSKATFGSSLDIITDYVY